MAIEVVACCSVPPSPHAALDCGSDCVTSVGMRLKSEIWVQAYLRRCAIAGVSAMLVHRGDSDAGAIFVKLATLDGQAQLFGPPPAGFGTEDFDRWLAPVFDPPAKPEREIDHYLAEQKRYDPDLWIVEVEDRRGRHFLDDWLVKD